MLGTVLLVVADPAADLEMSPKPISHSPPSGAAEISDLEEQLGSVDRFATSTSSSTRPSSPVTAK